ncbi:MAG: SusD/RagB family nutrient-binding outer membrane lipoprotein [Chryseobacterium sp.]|jgi:hypothetical protein|uniref:SusD/RagB family nutrient-binding outer membrane lipoprotein n=1 Tax=Chryseobacterium sp. TaxID=1871047 RepID=UPI00281A5E48|nr:SusD/RagB family nutrient-binding outer membrane lipoprotein [Chryseobacterium sp.]MDR2237791.1 SusD/RagB family nutrient-binding outer membrane lipoprotein [Chryseobacterium sp.]
MKKIFLYSSIAIAAFTTSCRELDDNISPNNVDPGSISPRQMLTASENAVFSTQAGTMNSLSNIWTNTWAGNYYYYGNPLTREYSLDISNTFSTGIWSSSYITANNLQNIINNGSSLPLHSAIARILKAYTMQYVVDFYGDAPYSEAFKGQANLSPKYDDDAAIYRSLVLEINKAIDDIDATTVVNASNLVTPAEDVIFGGNMDNWKKFAKNVKLKILLRQSKVTDSSIKSFVDAQLQTLATANPNDFYLTDVIINPGYSNLNGSTVNPLFANYGALDYQGVSLNDDWRLYKVTQYYANSVNGTSYGAGTGDLRGTKQFGKLNPSNNLSAASTVGIKQGGIKPPGSTEWQYSFLGWKFAKSNSAFYDFAAEGVSTAGVEIASEGSQMDGYLALDAENRLLLAEAAVLYPAVFTYDPSALYREAVENSFKFYDLTASQATQYLNNLNTTSVGWGGAPSKIAAIQYQRFVSLANIRQVETYVNFLKTGYPNIPVADNAMYPNKPYRLIYPLSEYTGNSSNVPNITQAQVFAKNQFTPFWNQN